jgi:type I restriction enzyme S subunit
MHSKFLHYSLTSKEYKDSLLNTGEKSGATRQALTKSQIEEVLIRYPKSLNEQQIIITKIESLSDETKKLEAIYQQKLTDLDELKKVILQKAFRGELTTVSADALTA